MPQRKPLSDHPASSLVLRTLGAAEARSESSTGSRIGRYGPGKPFALLTYLSHAPKLSATRDQLVELLWADVGVESARHALRQTLWYIKRTLGDGLLTTSDDVIQLSVPVDSDSVAFVAAVNANDVDRAVLLYGGEFLPSFALPGGGAFEQWAGMERGRLRTMFTRCADQIITRELSAGRARAVLPLARAARDADRDDERLWRRVLEVHLAARDSVGAETEAAALVAYLLNEEREAEPSTVALLRAARRAPTGSENEPPGGAPFSTALVGRTAEFAALTSAWDSVQKGGRSAHIHVSAPAGLGKSRLLADVRARLKASRARVVSLRASTSERTISCALVAELAGELATLKGAAAVSPEVAGILVALNPTLSTHYSVPAEHAPETELMRRRTLALRDLLGAVAHERPVAVLIDDLHWADESSRAVLAACASKLAEANVLLVTTARASARSLFDETTTELVLAPLDATAIGELWASLGQAPAASWAERLPELLLRVAGGSPLLVIETIQLAMERGVLRLTDGAWSCEAPSRLAEQLATADPIGARIAMLSSRERRVLLALGVIGIPALADFVVACVDLDAEHTVAALRALEERGLCRREAGEYEIAHDAIAERVIARAEPDELCARQFATGLAWSRLGQTDADVRRAAGHLAAAGAETELTALGVSWFANQRRWGDRRRAGTLIRGFLGEFISTERAAALRSALPLWVRHPSVIPLSAVAVIVIALGALGYAAQPTPAMELHLVGVQLDSGGAKPARLTLDEHSWVGGELELSRFEHSHAPAFTDNPNRPVPLPDGTAWVTWLDAGDRGGWDLYRINRSGERVRLTAEPGDDEIPLVAPDGRSLLFGTTRFDTAMGVQMARLDLSTRRVRQVSAPGMLESPRAWSPDGSRIAFSRHYRATGADSVCVADADFSHQECLGAFVPPIGWTDDGHLMVRQGGDGGALMNLNLITGALDTVYSSVVDAVFSPDHQWMLCSGHRDGYDGTVWWIAPVRAPSSVRVLKSHGMLVRGLSPIWDVHLPARHDIERMQIAVHDTLESLVASLLAVNAFEPSGAAVRPDVVRWQSLDDSVASLSDDGMLTPHRDGVARIVASAGGWRADTARVTIRARPARLLYGAPVGEPRFRDEWIFFGDPRPQVIATTTGPALWVAGDSSFISGVRFHRSVTATHGLSVRARFRVPASLGRWQMISLSLGSSEADSLWRQWDKTIGPAPHPSSSSTGCQFAYPNDEGVAALTAFMARAIAETKTFMAPQAMRAGDWFTAEVQLLPDGRCGVAVDGEPVWLSLARQPVETAMEARVMGMSVRTQVLADSITLYEGVRRPEMWVTFEGKASLRHAAPPGAGRR